MVHTLYLGVVSASHRSHIGAVPTSSGSGLEGFKAYSVFKEIENRLHEVQRHAVTNKSPPCPLI